MFVLAREEDTYLSCRTAAGPRDIASAITYSVLRQYRGDALG